MLARVDLLGVGSWGGFSSDSVYTWYVYHGWHLAISFILVLYGIVQHLAYLILLDCSLCSIWKVLSDLILRIPSMSLSLRDAWVTPPDLLRVPRGCLWVLAGSWSYISYLFHQGFSKVLGITSSQIQVMFWEVFSLPSCFVVLWWRRAERYLFPVL